MTKHASVVHLAPTGACCLCCGQTPFELPRTERITVDASKVTCMRAIVHVVIGGRLSGKWGYARELAAKTRAVLVDADAAPPFVSASSLVIVSRIPSKKSQQWIADLIESKRVTVHKLPKETP